MARRNGVALLRLPGRSLPNWTWNIVRTPPPVVANLARLCPRLGGPCWECTHRMARRIGVALPCLSHKGTPSRGTSFLLFSGPSPVAPLCLARTGVFCSLLQWNPARRVGVLDRWHKWVVGLGKSPLLRRPVSVGFRRGLVFRTTFVRRRSCRSQRWGPRCILVARGRALRPTNAKVTRMACLQGQQVTGWVPSYQLETPESTNPAPKSEC